MILAGCQHSFDRLMRYFAWLVEDYGFVVIHSESGTMGYCGFTLQSGDTRLFMDVERGFLQFGQLALAPATKRLGTLTPESRWYTVDDIIDYLRGCYLSWSEIEERNRSLMTLSEDESMTKLSAECRALWPQIMTLFQEEEFTRRQEDLESFLKSKHEDQRRQRKELVRQEEARWLPKWRERQQQTKDDNNHD